MRIHGGLQPKVYLVQPIGHVLVAQDAADAREDAEYRWGKGQTVERVSARPSLSTPVHYSTSIRLDTYA